MPVTRRSVANELAETAHALLRDEGIEMVLERLDKSQQDLLEIHTDAEKLKHDTEKPSTSD